MTSLRLSIPLFLFISGCATFVLAQDEADVEDSPYRSGLVARYAGDNGASAVRIDEAIAFQWQSAAPDPRLVPGTFTVTWTGRLLTQVPGSYALRVYAGGGRFSLKLAGKLLIKGEAQEPKWFAAEPVEFAFGYQPLEITFEKTAEAPQIALFWSGPNFVLEPVPERFLFHDREGAPSSDFERGRRLASALRCAACHEEEDGKQSLPAPALDRLSGNIQPAWLIDWLGGKGDPPGRTVEPLRRMPHFDLTKVEAADIASWLLRLPAEKPAEPKAIEQKDAKTAKKGKEKAKDGPTRPSAEQGQHLFLTLGCLACHQHGELGESGLFGGGDLTNIAAKRPPEFFARWLTDPASLNRHHRMPVFDLSKGERESLAMFLSAGNALRGVSGASGKLGDADAGGKLVTRFQCASCHALPGVANAPATSKHKPLTTASDWSRSCAGTPHLKANRPGYRLAPADQTALKAFFTSRATPGTPPRTFPTAIQSVGRDLLVELNCLACHAREGIDRKSNALPARLQDKLADVVSLHDDLGKLVPAMTPPALNAVGDKLTDAALAAAIRRTDKPHRPYLMVRMPKYDLTDERLATLTSYFTTTDRIPAANPQSAIRNPLLAAAGPRLVTTDGFGCTSCHQVGSVLPDKAPLNARGPDLSMLEKRIRREWFDRWCYSPARIVPRMEMPSVQIPVRGVLGDNVNDQLAAVWHILNTPGFEPPEPNPVRVLRLSGVPERKERPIVLHDVIKSGDKTYLFPLVIGLPNRHNILFDLETNRLAAWWLGDTARQRTKGKSWYWEPGGESLYAGANESELTLIIDGKERLPRPIGQFRADLVGYTNHPYDAALDRGPECNFICSIDFDFPRSEHDRLNEATWRPLNQVFRSFTAEDGTRSGFDRRYYLYGLGPIDEVRFRLASPEIASDSRWEPATRTLTLPGEQRLQIEVKEPEGVQWNEEGYVVIPAASLRRRENQPLHWGALIDLRYTMPASADQYLIDPVPPTVSAPSRVSIAPGFDGRRLPLPTDIMPSGLTWTSNGALLFSTLKGPVITAEDNDEDGVEEKWRIAADGLATPYGIVATPQGRDEKDRTFVAVKRGLFEVGLDGDIGLALASGWGATDDYHDWAVGLVPDESGGYYLGLPCQQDQRSEAAAKHRGQLLRLVPRKRVTDKMFDIEVVSSGHRFPMGLARNREGALFVTDNQGNYNPFNELNHVRPGAHFGFINALEKDKGFKPPRYDKPAIDIPHPWTRSVNGICFLDTPAALREKTGKEVFGPLEGHLIGCEYDTRALIRMTLQKVGDTYQGAAYPLSIPPENVEDGLLGPIVCAVSPRGELYVGNIRDSGWGAGNNVGDIVQIKIEPDKLPCGIAEVRANKDGFTIDFFRPVDPAKARDPANYSIASYRRESTPAYGGPNLDRRAEKIGSIELSPDAKRVTLRLADLRPGFLYEFQLKPLAPGKEPFHPAEAHYTLNQIP